MGHAMNAIAGVFNFGPNARGKKNIQGIESAAAQTSQNLNTLNAPPPPAPPTLAQDWAKDNSEAVRAAAAARKKAMANTGYSGTILTSPAAPPPQAGPRKTALGL